MKEELEDIIEVKETEKIEKVTIKKRKVIKKVTKYKIYNKTYQELSIIVNGKLKILAPKGKKDIIIVETKSNQINNLKERNKIKIIEFKE